MIWGSGSHGPSIETTISPSTILCHQPVCTAVTCTRFCLQGRHLEDAPRWGLLKSGGPIGTFPFCENYKHFSWANIKCISGYVCIQHAHTHICIYIRIYIYIEALQCSTGALAIHCNPLLCLSLAALGQSNLRRPRRKNTTEGTPNRTPPRP